MADVSRVLTKFQKERAIGQSLGWRGWLRYRLQRRRLDRAAYATLFTLTSKTALWPLRCRARTSDVHSFHQVFIQREYACLDALDTQTVGLIVDCGANVGYSSAYLLSRFPNCHLIAVEPDAENFAVLEANLAPYGLRARARRAAVWSHPASLTLCANWVRAGNEWARAVRECEPGETAAFSAVSVGQLLKDSGFERIAILKMDIEGAEAVVFSGDYDDWLARVDNLVIELHHVSPYGSTYGKFFQAVAGRGLDLSHSGELTVCRRVAPPALDPGGCETPAGGDEPTERARLHAENARLRECLRDLMIATRAVLAAPSAPVDRAALERAERILAANDAPSESSDFGPKPSAKYIVFGAPQIEEEEIAEMCATLRSGWIGTGPKVRRFEDLFREYVGARHAVAVNSCTAALHLSLLVSGVGPGDEVITTPMTFCATANAILHAGARPVFVDVDRATMNLDPARIAAAITPRTRAILPVHLAGRPCPMDEIQELAARHGLLVIEDAAHCIEGQYRGRKVGTISPLTCFSFYVTKNMTTGEGGMVTTNNDELAARIKMYALHGMSADAWNRFSDKGYKHYQVVFPGFKYNMTDMQASLGLHQIGRLDRHLGRRRDIWRYYDDQFVDLPVRTPALSDPDTVHARHLYTLRVIPDQCRKGRDEVLQELHELGIGTGVHYTALHLHPYYRATFGYREGMLPHAEEIGATTFSLPLSAKLSDEDVERVVAGVRTVLTDTRTRRVDRTENLSATL
jgi:FkbM family methyltransferase